MFYIITYIRTWNGNMGGLRLGAVYMLVLLFGPV